MNATALIFAGVGPVLWIAVRVAGRRARSTWRRALGVTRAHRRADARSRRCGGSPGLEMQGTYGLDILKYTETVQAVATTSIAERGPARPRLLVLLRRRPHRAVDRVGEPLHAAPGVICSPATGSSSLSLLAAGVRALAAPAVLRRAARSSGWSSRSGRRPYAHPTPLGAVFKAFANSSTRRARAAQHRARGAARRARARGACSASASNAACRCAAPARARPCSACAVIGARACVLIVVNLPALVRRHVLRQEPRAARERARVLDAGDRKYLDAQGDTRPACSRSRAPTSRRTRGATPSTRSRPGSWTGRTSRAS